MRSLDWIVRFIDPLPDYILKADLDYFIIPQNLEKFILKQYNPEEPIMFGNMMYSRPEVTKDFPAGKF